MKTLKKLPKSRTLTPPSKGIIDIVIPPGYEARIRIGKRFELHPRGVEDFSPSSKK